MLSTLAELQISEKIVRVESDIYLRTQRLKTFLGKNLFVEKPKPFRNSFVLSVVCCTLSVSHVHSYEFLFKVWVGGFSPVSFVLSTFSLPCLFPPSGHHNFNFVSDVSASE